MFELSLFFILTFITFINAYKVRLINLVLKLIPEDPQIRSINADVVTLEKELRGTSMLNEFAKHVKLQRRITKLKEEKIKIVNKQAFRTMKIRFSLMAALHVLIFGTLVSLMWFYRSEPVVKVPAHWLWPFSSFFGWCNPIPGSVTVPCWVAISSSASKTLAKHF